MRELWRARRSLLTLLLIQAKQPQPLLIMLVSRLFPSTAQVIWSLNRTVLHWKKHFLQILNVKSYRDDSDKRETPGELV